MTASKLRALKTICRDLKSILIAFSGGVDSTLLAKVAKDVLGNQAAAAVALSPSMPKKEHLAARRLAGEIGIKLFEVETREMGNYAYLQNGRDRCYHCKSELFHQLFKLAGKEGFAVVADGSNADDIHNFRPGAKAACEKGVRHPLIDADLTKEEIRVLSKSLGLPTWNKPSLACLASRIPYGTPITINALVRVENVEEKMLELGFSQVRARFHHPLVRIEVDPADMRRVLDPTIRKEIIRAGRKQGFTYVTLDLAGYREGSMDETSEY